MGIFSSREIDYELNTDTASMYLAPMQKPSYRTIVRFRTTKEALKDETRKRLSPYAGKTEYAK
jgi:transposase